MSRCFPYLPPACPRDLESGEAVSESIKLPSKRRKVITEHHDYQKYKKQEKKQKRKDREKKQEGKLVIRFKCDKSDKYLLPKQIEEEAEKSDLSEEHGQPLPSQNFCYTLETFESGIKGKRDDLISAGGRNHGNIIRIRLPLRKNAGPVRGEQLCSTSGRSDSSYERQDLHDGPSQENSSLTHLKASPIIERTNSRPEKAPSILDSERKDEAVFPTEHCENVSPAPQSLFKTLVEDWVPPPMQLQQTNFDDDWLFGAKKQITYGHKRFEAHGAMDHESCALWPQARYMAEADLYALPYTIPF